MHSSIELPFSHRSRISSRDIIASHSAVWVELGISSKFILRPQILIAVGRKSQLAIEYAYRFRKYNPQSHIFWVYAANFALFEQAYRDMARSLKLSEPNDRDVDLCQLFSRWLKEEEDASWLLILDNADSTDVVVPRTASIVAETSTDTHEALIRFLPKRLVAKK